MYSIRTPTQDTKLRTPNSGHQTQDTMDTYSGHLLRTPTQDTYSGHYTIQCPDKRISRPNYRGGFKMALIPDPIKPLTCSSPSTVDVSLSSSTPTYRGAFLSEIRAKSSTFRVCVAEKRTVCRFSNSGEKKISRKNIRIVSSSNYGSSIALLNQHPQNPHA